MFYVMEKVFGTDFSLLQFEWEKCLQTLAVSYVMVLHLSFFIGFLPFLLLFTRLWWLISLYGIWLYIDRRTPQRGGFSERYIKWWRGLWIHQYFRDYFPCYLHKTVDLPSGKNYLIGSHPHGIIAAGGYSCFCTNANRLYESFPGLKVRHATIDLQFWTPLRRDFLLLHGYVSCSRRSLINFLDTDRTLNHALVLVIGGVSEMLDAHPGFNSLTLRNRKGFIRVALETGAHLVPMYIFGENELFEQVSNPYGSKVRIVQDYLKNLFKFSVPLFYGKGLTHRSYGLLPHRKRIDVVLGKPIPVNKTSHPTEAEVDQLHEEYVASLVKLFEDNKRKFGVSSEERLVIV